ncbi:4068_t:CDS:10, partial [Funneliformis caledonium]
IPDWIQFMQNHNYALERFIKANGRYMLYDTSKPLKVLTIHSKLQTNKDYSSNPYYYAITKKENISTSPWVPILPSYYIIEKFGDQYVCLEIQIGAGLIGGINRQQLQTIFSMIGIIAQSSKGYYHNKQNEYLENIINKVETSAKIALAKAIAQIKTKECLEGYSHKLIIAYAIAEKSQAAEVLLDIGVDGDLNSNKTLNNIPYVNKVYADLKHIGKNIRAKITSERKLDENKITILDAELEKVHIDRLVAHLSDDHSLIIVISPLVSLIDDQVIETIATRIGCASIYARKYQSSQYFEKVFSEIAIRLIKLLYITAESFICNKSFTAMLLNFAKYAPVSFVIDEVHCIVECNPIMMLTGTCKKSDTQLTMEVHSKSIKEKTIGKIIKLLKELEERKCIVYCLTVRAYNDIYEQLYGKSDLKLMMAVYYSSLDGEEKKKKLKLWKDNTIQLIIVINAFGMSLNDKKVRLVIHYAFLLNTETGRAERDHNPAKSVIFYSCHDICINYIIITQGRELVIENMNNNSFEANKRQAYLARAREKIFEVIHFCEEQYICKEYMLAKYFA